MEALDPTYAAQIPRGIDLWKDSIDKYADEKGFSNLHMIQFVKMFPSLGTDCVPEPPNGSVLQRLHIDSLGVDACLALPTPPNLPDVIIVDVPFSPAEFAGVLGITVGASEYLWYLQQQGVPVRYDGSYIGPVLILLPDDDNNLQPFGTGDKFNVATHEFGHAFGLGHTQPDAALDSDMMYPSYPAGHYFSLKCVSTLDLAAVEKAYGWLGGPFGPIPPYSSIQQSEYNSQYDCPPPA